MHDYEMLAIGSGPAGQKAAIAAAKLGRRAAVAERAPMVGGVCVTSGTIPSKTVREVVLHLTGLRHREHYGASYRVKDDITVDDLAAQTRLVVEREVDVIRDQLRRNHVQLLSGAARFLDPHRVVIEPRRQAPFEVTAEKVVVAVGTRPARPPGVEFDGKTVVDSDGVLGLQRIPGSVVVVGAGVIGIEFASIFAALGCAVTVVERRDRMIEFCDDEIVESLRYHLRDLNVTFRFGEHVSAVEAHEGGTITVLASGKKIPAETVVYSAGRQGSTEHLDLECAGLVADDRGRIEVDEWFQTTVPHIYAAGDVIGFPALAATSMEQGRLAAYHAFGEPTHRFEELYPIGIYTIPEISYVGRNETQLTTDQVPYEVGVARYRELARGQIVGDTYGMLKLLVSPADRRLLGVHVFGTAATEIVHLGQALMAGGMPVDYLVDNVFNYPTLTEAYKVAALDATNKLRTIERVSGQPPNTAQPASPPDAASSRRP
ncbi:MAG: Si-specific NAD(P)(+) transhydrogenase [Acidimicrobiia bacterium]